MNLGYLLTNICLQKMCTASIALGCVVWLRGKEGRMMEWKKENRGGSFLPFPLPTSLLSFSSQRSLSIGLLLDSGDTEMG